jgi:hypothetical protein
MSGLSDIQRRMAGLSDDELRRVVTVDADDWQPEAREEARQEMERRNLVGPDPYRAPGNQQLGPSAPLPDRRRPDVSKGVPLIFFALILVRALIYLLHN